MLSESDQASCESAARPWGVSPKIHPDDFIYRFLIDNPSFSSKDLAIRYYFNDGAASARKLAELIRQVCRLDGERVSLLEFASGYGCVTRHFGQALPFGAAIACDIHPQAMAFIRNELGMATALSTNAPEDLQLGQTFEVVFALSFFSHMPKPTFPRWLKALAAATQPGGYLIFTTHGQLSRRFFPGNQLDADGFYFSGASEQKDLSTTDYGSAVVSPQYVFARLAEIPGCQLTFFREGYWWEHQDVFIVRVER